MTRNLKGSGLEEGASTCLLVRAGKLIVSGLIRLPRRVVQALTDDVAYVGGR